MIAQGYAVFNTAGVVSDSFQVASVVKNSTGNFTINLSENLLVNQYYPVVTACDNSETLISGKVTVIGEADGLPYCIVEFRGSDNELKDPNIGAYFIAF